MRNLTWIFALLALLAAVAWACNPGPAEGGGRCCETHRRHSLRAGEVMFCPAREIPGWVGRIGQFRP